MSRRTGTHVLLHLLASALAHDASRSAPAAARSTRAAAAPARMLRASRLLLLLNPRVLQLRLHKRACAWGLRSYMRERGWEHNAHTYVDPSWMLHRGGGPSPLVQG
jgi:hypothetical protein